jgi:hypothetical protein
MKAGSEVDVGQSLLIIGKLDRRLGFSGYRRLRWRRSDFPDRDAARLPDDHLRHRNLLSKRNGVFDVGLDEGLWARLGLRDFLQSGRGLRWLAGRSRGMSAGSRSRITNFGRSARVVRNAEIKLADFVVLRIHPDKRRPVSDDEPHCGDQQDVKDGGSRNRGGAAVTEVGPFAEETLSVRRTHPQLDPPLEVLGSIGDFRNVRVDMGTGAEIVRVYPHLGT